MTIPTGRANERYKCQRLTPIQHSVIGMKLNNVNFIKMINKYNTATICSGKNCITVHGDAAKLVNAIAVSIAVLMLLHVTQKLLN